MIFRVEPEDFPGVYPEISKFFRSFEDRAGGDVAPGSLEAEIMRGERQCYVAVIDDEIRACALSTVGPAGGITLDYCAGDGREDWQEEMLGMFMAWARERGAALRVFCRHGWVRALDMKAKGFRETHRVMEVDYG